MTTSLVVPSSSLTITTSAPLRMLSRLLLPALGLPVRQIVTPEWSRGKFNVDAKCDFKDTRRGASIDLVLA